MKLFRRQKVLSKVLMCLSFSSILIGQVQVNAAMGDQPPAGIGAQSRNSTMNSLEFFALARALGLKTFTQKIHEEGLASNEQMNIYEQRLISAQEGWLNFQNLEAVDSRDVSKSIRAVKDFLSLERQALWPRQTMSTFFEFYRRLVVMDPVNKEQYSIEAAIRLKYLLLQQDSVAIPIELKSYLPRLAVRWISFSSLDHSIVGVISSGFWYERLAGRFPLIYDSSSELADSSSQHLDSLPKATKTQTSPQNLFQVVSISNQFYPSYATVNLNDDDTELEKKLTPKRFLQESDDQCRLLGIDESRETEIIFIDQERCESLQKEHTENHELSSLGLSHHPIENDPFQNREPIQPISRIKPWVWIAIGSLAATALVISHYRDSRGPATKSSPAPSPVIHSTGW